jgi:histone deacetylase 1/2
MDTEYTSLMKNNTWQLVPPQSGVNIIDSKWVYKIKHNPDGSIERYNARLVARASSNGMDRTMRIYATQW